MTRYENYIKDIGPVTHYWSTLQIHVFNEYCRSSRLKIAIDATGDVVRKLRRPNRHLWGTIFLYDVVVQDPTTKKQNTLSNMLFKRCDKDRILWVEKLYQR